MNIYAIRHGQTEMNVKGLINGTVPDNLTDVGKEQARLAAKNLPSTINRIYSSPLTRARQTAEILNAALKLPITYHDELMEVNFGDLQGTPFLEEHQEKHINLDYDWRPSGECFDDVKQRVCKLLSEIQQENSDGEVLLVVHGGIVRMLTYLEKGTKRGEISNAGLFEFDLDKILASN